MTPEQIASIVALVNGAEEIGVTIVGGITALIGMLRVQMTEADRQAVITAVEKDATIRAANRAKILAAAAASAAGQ
jgi:hypothetical protein